MVETFLTRGKFKKVDKKERESLGRRGNNGEKIFVFNLTSRSRVKNTKTWLFLYS